MHCARHEHDSRRGCTLLYLAIVLAAMMTTLLAASSTSAAPLPSDRKLYSYLCLNIRRGNVTDQTNCLGISPGNEKTPRASKGYLLQIKPRIRNEKIGKDFKKLRWTVDYKNGHIWLSNFTDLCIGRMDPDTPSAGILPCSTGRPDLLTWNLTTFRASGVNETGTIRLAKQPKLCLTVMKCNRIGKGAKSYCDKNSLNPLPAGKTPDSGAYVRLLPCDNDNSVVFSQAIDCAPGCSPYMLGGKCDAACKNDACNWDDLTCATPHPTPPTRSPTDSPTRSPTRAPSASPTSSRPTKSPTRAPSASPTDSPTLHPSQSPTMEPTAKPTTLSPSRLPTFSPTQAPTTVSDSPSVSPTLSPTTPAPTSSPSASPTKAPTNATSLPAVNGVASSPDLTGLWAVIGILLILLVCGRIDIIWILFLAIFTCLCPCVLVELAKRDKKRKELEAKSRGEDDKRRSANLEKRVSTDFRNMPIDLDVEAADVERKTVGGEPLAEKRPLAEPAPAAPEAKRIPPAMAADELLIDTPKGSPNPDAKTGESAFSAEEEEEEASDKLNPLDNSRVTGEGEPPDTPRTAAFKKAMAPKEESAYRPKGAEPSLFWGGNQRVHGSNSEAKQILRKTSEKFTQDVLPETVKRRSERIARPDELERMSVKELRSFIVGYGGITSDCVEKSDLIARAKEVVAKAAPKNEDEML